MRLRRKPLPAVQVDANEDGLEEKGESFDREAQPQSGAEPTHQARPQDAELKGKDGSRHGSDGELHRHHNGPSPRDSQRDRVIAGNTDPFHDERQRGERHAKRYQEDVRREGERHLDAAREEGRLAC